MSARDDAKDAILKEARDTVAGFNKREKSIFDLYYTPAPLFNTIRPTGVDGYKYRPATKEEFDALPENIKSRGKTTTNNLTGETSYEILEVDPAKQNLVVDPLAETQAINAAIELMNTRLKKGNIMSQQIADQGRRQVVSEDPRRKINQDTQGSPNVAAVGGKFVDNKRPNALRILGGLN